MSFQEEYVYYNGIPHKVLPTKSQPEPTRDVIRDTIELQKLILNPEDQYYILSERNKPQVQSKLISRSASETTQEKRLTAQKCLEITQRILEN